jgi:hypothetical protein
VVIDLSVDAGAAEKKTAPAQSGSEASPSANPTFVPR